MKGLEKNILNFIIHDSRIHDKEAMNKLEKDVKEEINDEAVLEVATGSYTSDAIRNCPKIFFKKMAEMFRSWLYHGTVTPSLLSCAYLPLFKGGLKDPASCSSYRALAGTSVILKLFDYTVLHIWGDVLSSDYSLLTRQTPAVVKLAGLSWK